MLILLEQIPWLGSILPFMATFLGSASAWAVGDFLHSPHQKQQEEQNYQQSLHRVWFLTTKSHAIRNEFSCTASNIELLGDFGVCVTFPESKTNQLSTRESIYISRSSPCETKPGLSHLNTFSPFFTQNR